MNRYSLNNPLFFGKLSALNGGYLPRSGISGGPQYPGTRRPLDTVRHPLRITPLGLGGASSTVDPSTKGDCHLLPPACLWSEFGELGISMSQISTSSV